MSEQNNNSADTKLVGLLAQFEDPGSLVSACDQARQAGYLKMDAYSPFPVHGIDPAIGIRRTRLPFIVLAVGLTGLFAGLGMEYYANAADWSPIFPGYKFAIGGKPYWSLPANIPVGFEIIVLSSAFATFFGMWTLNKLPRFANPLHRISRFKRATNDKFFLMLESTDENFDRQKSESQLNEWGASVVEECNEDMSDQQLPKWVQLTGFLLAMMLLIPPVLIFRASGLTSRQPRLHVVPDMDWQHKYKAQSVSPNFATEVKPDYLFEDGRAMREPIAGTIARGQLTIDGEYFRGIQSGSTSIVATTETKQVHTSLQDQEPAAKDAAPEKEPEPNWITSFPKNITIDQALLTRGQQRFDIYCSVCHGYDGNGNGLVNQHAMALAVGGKAQWTAVKSMHDPEVKNNEKNPVGRIFDTISNGRATMGPYKDQIPVEDRWAIVAYVKALQGTGIKPPATAVVADEADEKADADESGKP